MRARTHARSAEIYDASVLYVNVRTDGNRHCSEEQRSTSQSNGGDDKEESICVRTRASTDRETD